MNKQFAWWVRFWRELDDPTYKDEVKVTWQRVRDTMTALAPNRR